MKMSEFLKRHGEDVCDSFEREPRGYNWFFRDEDTDINIYMMENLEIEMKIEFAGFEIYDDTNIRFKDSMVEDNLLEYYKGFSLFDMIELQDKINTMVLHDSLDTALEVKDEKTRSKRVKI